MSAKNCAATISRPKDCSLFNQTVISDEVPLAVVSVAVGDSTGVSGLEQPEKTTPAAIAMAIALSALTEYTAVPLWLRLSKC